MLFLGYTGAFLVSTAYLPQILKLTREKNAEGISLPFLSILFAGSLLLLVYALWRHDPVFSALNAVAVILSGVTAVLALKVKREGEK